MKYRKKPVVIDAIQLTAGNIADVYRFMGQNPPEPKPNDIATDRWDEYEKSICQDGMDITTLEDGPDGRAHHVATLGDWVIKGVQGEFYPCKPDIFKKTYEEVEI